ncbi:putative ABC transporter permease protein [Microbacterium sp. C448]|uniref:ABC transporter permease n=1 Tax=Microbacterium sp. C448 TaxID=1177594 RepID=UPI0003DE2586|nr:ABC transporter permease [Microbacterium sp. C448]CDJ99066.1 putative ABC transporter permease protein [Microbacterium sp. C448]
MSVSLEDVSTQGLATSPAHSEAMRTAERRLRRRRSWLVFLGRLLLLVVACLLWWAVGALGWLSTFYISSPAEVAQAIVTAFTVDGFGEDLMSTLFATFVGFAVGALLGILVGLGLGVLPPYINAVVDPFIMALNSLPRIALAPLFIVFFGLDELSKIAVSITLVFFVLLISARSGILNVNPDLLHLVSAMRLTRAQLFTKLMFPAALPSIFAGLTIGMTYSLLGVVSAEIIASKRGVGVLIQQYSGTFNMAGTYAVLIVLAIVAALINELMLQAQRAALRWQTV